MKLQVAAYVLLGLLLLAFASQHVNGMHFTVLYYYSFAILNSMYVLAQLEIAVLLQQYLSL